AAPGPASPALIVGVSGDCPGCVASAVGTGFHPNSSITLHGEISSPFTGRTDIPDFAMPDGNGSWSFTGTIPCDFGDGPFVGQFIEDVIAANAGGAYASGPPTAHGV